MGLHRQTDGMSLQDRSRMIDTHVFPRADIWRMADQVIAILYSIYPNASVVLYF